MEDDVRANKPANKATSKPASKATSKPAHKAADKATDKATDKPADKPASKAATAPGNTPTDIGRNDPCHCGSGKKYKQCHLAADEAKSRDARAKAVAQAPAPAAESAPAAPSGPPRHMTRQPWKKTATNTQGFGKTSLPRKVGGS